MTKKYTVGLDSKAVSDGILNLTVFAGDVFMTLGGSVTVLFLLMLDIIFGGISWYQIFIRVDIPGFNPTMAALSVSITLSGVSVAAMTYLNDLFAIGRAKRKFGGYAKMVGVGIFIAGVWALDTWVDMSFMELITPPASGDIFNFLNPDALVVYPRPPMWWGAAVLLGALSTASEPFASYVMRGLKERIVGAQVGVSFPGGKVGKRGTVQKGKAAQVPTRRSPTPVARKTEMPYNPTRGPVRQYGAETYNKERMGIDVRENNVRK